MSSSSQSKLKCETSNKSRYEIETDIEMNDTSEDINALDAIHTSAANYERGNLSDESGSNESEINKLKSEN